MNKQEFIEKWCKQPVCNMGSGVYLEFPEEIEIELNDIIQQAISDHEAKQWKEYPKDAPDHEGNLNKEYLLKFSDGCYEIDTWDGQSWNVFSDAKNATWNPIAFRELPAPYQPKEGGEE